MKRKIKIIIAPDSFKGSIGAAEAAEAIKAGLAETLGDADLLTLPIADGGEGTLDAMTGKTPLTSLSVPGPLGDTVTARFGHVGNVAVIEMASAAGLTLVEEKKRSAMRTTTYGVGRIILRALDDGYRKLMLTVGGSGTNDGGCGMFSALGARFLKEDGTAFVPCGGTLSEIAGIDLGGLDIRLKDCVFTVATDVRNPLLGEHGATRVYARQKGANDRELDLMEAGMSHYADILRQMCGRDIAAIPGCGAGGGFAAPLLAFLNAQIRSGIEAVLETVHFADALKGADAVITGEGKIDRQSLYGKAISGVAGLAGKAGVPVYCLVGCVGDDREELKKMGVSEIYALTDIAPSAEYAMAHPAQLLQELAQRFAKEHFPGM